VEAFERKVPDSFARQLFMSTIGAEITAVGRGSVEIRLPFSSRLIQQNGFVHAGAITSILDSACGYAALSVAPEEAEVLSVEFKVNFLAPGVGESFVARASVKRAGKRLTVCTADAFAVKAGAEKLIATMGNGDERRYDPELICENQSRARFLIQIGEPTNPKAFRSWFSRNRW
jgi:uncharacterized protein (TIGR00369 family)